MIAADGGPGGLPAAIAALRAGMKTLLAAALCAANHIRNNELDTDYLLICAVRWLKAEASGSEKNVPAH